MLGYRQCGERAVRVDILERLADLIRPALAWRETSAGEKPAGAFDGRGFVVTQAMTSLTGSAGEDFASILRALGYRDGAPPAFAAEAGGGRNRRSRDARARGGGRSAAAESATEAVARPRGTEPAEAETALPVSGDPAPSAARLPDVSPALAADQEAPAAIEAQPEPVTAVESCR